MSRLNRTIENLIGGQCKIRKRDCTTSSSSSLKSYKFKRAVLVKNKRGTTNPPGPTWKVNSRSPAAASMVRIAESPNLHNGFRGKQAPVSARKLAASLWEMNEMPSSFRLKEELYEKRKKSKGKMAPSVYSGSFPQHLYDPSHSPVSMRTDRSKTSGSTHRRATTRIRRRYNGSYDSSSNVSILEIEARSGRRTPAGAVVPVKSHLKDLSNGLITAKELLKVLSRIWGIEEYYSSAKSLVSALGAELDRAHSQVGQLIQEQHSHHKEINYLMKHFAEEKTALKRRMQERFKAAVKTVAADIGMERKLRRRTESLNKALAKDLAETKIALSNTVKELKTEKRSREIVEEVCNELARGMGEDRAEVEEVKKEARKVREEVEKEREMLHVADVLREERVQMKLMEAKYQFEEKNTAVEKLRNELESYLKAKNDNKYQCENEKDEGDTEVGDESKDGDIEDDSNESDLHSIELNMDNNNRNFMWSYATGPAHEDAKRLSTESEIKGKIFTLDKTAMGRKSLERYVTEAFKRVANAENFQMRGDDFDGETMEYESMNGLRDHIMSTSRLTPTRDYMSPMREWGKL